ncbi:MAG: beta-phosphoglucomutase [Angelakisella sp.]
MQQYFKMSESCSDVEMELLMNPKAFLFDLDGVLTDTAEYHYLAWKELAEELQLKFDRGDNERLKGVSRIRSFEILLEINDALNRFSEAEKNDYANRKNLRYQQLIEQIRPSDLLPGIPEFLAQAKTHGMLLAVASASKNADKVLRLLGIAQQFDYIADAALVRNSKPDPEVFLVCAAALGVPPEACIGFEDAQAGIEAIHGAQMFSVGIHVEVKTQPPMLALASTAELKLQTVLQAFARHRATAASQR